jgi:hypothetical protein
MLPRTRLSPLRSSVAGAVAFAILAGVPGAAFAQASPECQKGIELFKGRIVWIQKLQALPRKHADPVTACSILSNLGAANARVLAWTRKNKDWCSIGDDQLAGLEKEAQQVGGIRANACKVAAQYNKLKQQALQAQKNRQEDGFSVDMSSDPLAPPVKIPPSAL